MSYYFRVTQLNMIVFMHQEMLEDIKLSFNFNKVKFLCKVYN